MRDSFSERGPGIRELQRSVDVELRDVEPFAFVLRRGVQLGVRKSTDTKHGQRTITGV